mmetsp:Transcript_6923/g.9692  ORF Transcript_6923/g.9692 Transcript_6923/m.9692 type:complete len:89 (+) Transcript_6923:158-424(+)
MLCYQKDAATLVAGSLLLSIYYFFWLEKEETYESCSIGVKPSYCEVDKPSDLRIGGTITGKDRPKPPITHEKKTIGSLSIKRINQPFG